MTEFRSVALVVAGVAFAAFLVLKLLAPRASRSAAAQQARMRIIDARRRSADRSAPAAQRAAALREAAVIALEELRRPNLASSYARRAERLDPGNAESVGLLAAALRRASRFVALEHLLWRRLADADADSAIYLRSLDELIGLYEGPLQRPEVARAIRRMIKPAA